MAQIEKGDIDVTPEDKRVISRARSIKVTISKSFSRSKNIINGLVHTKILRKYDFHQKVGNVSELAVKQGFKNGTASFVQGLRPVLRPRSGPGSQDELCLRPDQNQKLFKGFRSDQVLIVAYYEL